MEYLEHGVSDLCGDYTNSDRHRSEFAQETVNIQLPWSTCFADARCQIRKVNVV